MSFQITIGRTKETQVEVHLDGRNPTNVPNHIAIGIGKKEEHYTNWLAKCFKGENDRLLRFLAYIVLQGKEKGDIALICRCKYRWHAPVIKQFIEENMETFKMMLPYLFPHLVSEPLPKASETAPETSLPAPQEYVEQDGFKVPQKALQYLSKEDFDTFKDLIQKDQEQSAINPTDTVIDTSNCQVIDLSEAQKQ